MKCAERLAKEQQAQVSIRQNRHRLRGADLGLSDWAGSGPWNTRAQKILMVNFVSLDVLQVEMAAQFRNQFLFGSGMAAAVISPHQVAYYGISVFQPIEED